MFRQIEVDGAVFRIPVSEEEYKSQENFNVRDFIQEHTFEASLIFTDVVGNIHLFSNPQHLCIGHIDCV